MINECSGKIFILRLSAALNSNRPHASFFSSSAPSATRHAGTCWEGGALWVAQRGVLAPTLLPPPSTASAWQSRPPSHKPPPTCSSRNQRICNLPAVMNRGRLHVWLPPQAQMDDSGMLKCLLRGRGWQTRRVGADSVSVLFLFFSQMFGRTISVPVSGTGPNGWCGQIQAKLLLLIFLKISQPTDQRANANDLAANVQQFQWKTSLVGELLIRE